ncbi:MAG: GAF domain-containing protein [Caldilineaceae bacterium]|nr:GAF domain-containing protein [Caldilineaceae bacterium]
MTDNDLTAAADRRAHQLNALRTAALALTTEFDLRAVLQTVVDESRRLVAARYGALGVLDEAGDQIEQFITSGISEEERALIGPYPTGHGLLGVMIRHGRPLRVPDMRADARASGFPPHHPPMRTLLGVPIVSKGRIFGNLYLTDKEGGADGAPATFSAADQEMVELFAMQAAVAIENALLHRRSEQLVIAKERERFAMDLHDGIIQSIYAVGLTLDDARFYLAEKPAASRTRIDKAIHDLNDVITDLRNYIMALEPMRFQDRDLKSGLEELARALRANSFLAVDMAIDPAAADQLSRAQTMELLHIAKEALSNVRKHARATRAAIRVIAHADSVELLIEDDGAGFDPSLSSSPPHATSDDVDIHSEASLGNGNGLRNIRQRAASLQGQIAVDSRAGHGTRLRLTVPLDRSR